MKLNKFSSIFSQIRQGLEWGINLEEEECLGDFGSIFECGEGANRPNGDEVPFYSRGTQKSRWARSDLDFVRLKMVFSLWSPTEKSDKSRICPSMSEYIT